MLHSAQNGKNNILRCNNFYNIKRVYYILR